MSAQLTNTYYYLLEAMNEGGFSASFVALPFTFTAAATTSVFGRPYLRWGTATTMEWNRGTYDFTFGSFTVPRTIQLNTGNLQVEAAFQTVITVTKVNDSRFTIECGQGTPEKDPEFTFSGTATAGVDPSLNRKFKIHVRKRPELNIVFRFPEMWCTALVTNNVKEFRHVAGLEVENWTRC